MLYIFLFHYNLLWSALRDSWWWCRKGNDGQRPGWEGNWPSKEGGRIPGNLVCSCRGPKAVGRSTVCRTPPDSSSRGSPEGSPEISSSDRMCSRGWGFFMTTSWSSSSALMSSSSSSSPQWAAEFGEGEFRSLGMICDACVRWSGEERLRTLSWRRL